MKNLLIPNDLRSCRDLIKGRYTNLSPREHIEADYARFRYQFKRQFPPMRGERLRKTILATIGILTLFASIYILLAA